MTYNREEMAEEMYKMYKEGKDMEWRAFNFRSNAEYDWLLENGYTNFAEWWKEAHLS